VGIGEREGGGIEEWESGGMGERENVILSPEGAKYLLERANTLMLPFADER